MSERIESGTLVEAGLAAMSRAGKPLTKLPSKGRAMLYAMSNGETVRMRTCNDHLLIVVADRPSAEAKLNIEGTDWLLLVMPEVERSAGKIVAYLLPVSEVDAEARRTHREWLSTDPNTKGQNTTWNLWFRKDAPGKANDYATKWARYKLDSAVDVTDRAAPTQSGGNVKAEVEESRKRIAAAAGVPVEAVKITINFEG
jgi:hypothetical protein